MRSPKTVLITGGAGYVGSVLTKHLVDKGYDVTVFDRMFFGEESLSAFRNKIRIVKGDICCFPPGLFRTVASVIHLAGFSNDPMADYNRMANNIVNTKATIQLATQAKRLGVKRFIFASSCSIYHTLQNTSAAKNEKSFVSPLFPYAQSKYKAEQGIFPLQDKSFCVVALRKGTIFGFSPRMRYDLIVNAMLADALSRGIVHIYGGGNQWRPLISIEDVASSYRLMLEVPVSCIGGNIFNISYKNYRVKDVAKIVQTTVSKCTGKIIRVVEEETERQDRSYRVKTDKIRERISYFPKISVEEGIVEMTQQINQNPKFKDFANERFNNFRWMRPILDKEKYYEK